MLYLVLRKNSSRPPAGRSPLSGATRRDQPERHARSAGIIDRDRMFRTALLLVRDLLHFAALASSSQTSLAAENLFLRSNWRSMWSGRSSRGA